MTASPPARARPGLSPDVVVRTAIGLARAEGLNRLTMRRIAQELSTAPMSLYRHVADREALLLGMLDVVADGIELPPIAAAPRAEIENLMTGLHDGFRRDPWAVQVLATEGLASPRILPWVERMFAALRTAGLTVPEVAAGYACLVHYAYGEVLVAHHDRPDQYARRMVRAADPQQYPAVAEIVRELPIDAPRDYFATNLGRLLDGLLPPART